MVGLHECRNYPFYFPDILYLLTSSYFVIEKKYSDVEYSLVYI